ncbi:acetolactate synthase large subunit [Dongia soli]|uniref:Acetolactate synthase large subunit n=1 Tax=Dongia soli TaxID=600628 RepID=A0ABU5EEM2_9PROT|nr:acetolactate synthase large subunit [Dongia soli]MDY0884666.1 acetolactate synthase large subunit [Dongia soli]
MKASDLLVRCLEREGIKYIFGVPGEENADFMMSLQKSSIQFVLTRHEQGAAFMAEVHGRLTGEPAVCLGTLGPGATNLITGVADGNMDRAPMLVITGQGATTRQHKESHQIMDVVEMYKPVTKWAASIRHPDSIPEMVRKAVRLTRSEKPGAVLLELAEDVAKMETKAEPIEPHRYRRPQCDMKSLSEAVELIRQAKQPIIIAGNGMMRRRATPELRRLVEVTGIGVISTFMGKGAVARTSPHCLYTIGLQQKDYPAFAVDEADLVITIGYDLVEYPPRLWNPKGDKKIIDIDTLPAEIDNQYQAHVELTGEIATNLALLTEALEQGKHPKYDLPRQTHWRDKMTADLAAHKDDATEGTIRPQKVLWDVREALGPSDILLSGVGAHKMWIARYYHCDEPNTCIIPNGFCSMGLPLPGAIAAHLVAPDLAVANPATGKEKKPEPNVFAICGDGDFLMNVQEMETARRLNADITVMVWEDGGYGLIAWKQDNEFGKHTDLAFGNPKWLELANAFGWQGQYVDKAKDLAPALRKAIDHKGPSLIVVPIDYRENPLLTKRLGEIEVTI